MKITPAGLPALIVIDSGFSWESLSDANVLAVVDLNRDMFVEISPLAGKDQLMQFAGDHLNHGSTVLKNLRALAPNNPLILIRAFRGNSLIRTTWKANGTIATKGWTEAYLWAVELCKRLGLGSVANCSFGGRSHAMDGTGWEAYQLGKAGAGHIVVAASGAGNGRELHASWQAQPGKVVRLEAAQQAATEYNFWSGKSHQRWWLRVSLDGRVMNLFAGEGIPTNIWNDRQQLKFTVPGNGTVTFEFVIPETDAAPLTCDVWTVDDESSRFTTEQHVNKNVVSEPAVFANVVATGLRGGAYAIDQEVFGHKPDILIEGEGPLSFRTPEVTARVVQLLAADAKLTPAKAKQVIGKHL